MMLFKLLSQRMLVIPSATPGSHKDHGIIYPIIFAYYYYILFYNYYIITMILIISIIIIVLLPWPSTQKEL